MDIGKFDPNMTTSEPKAPLKADAASSHGHQNAHVTVVGVPVLASTALLQGGKSVLISHKGDLYRLQSTRQGKLILTK